MPHAWRLRYGMARSAQGYRLKADRVIHAVGPVWNGGHKGEDDLLAFCYRTALSLAATHRLASLAFPAISTGIYRFPAERGKDRGRDSDGGVSRCAARHHARGVLLLFAGCGRHHKTAFAELGLA